MKHLKNIIVSAVVAGTAITTFTGCEKFLDRKPLTATQDDLPGGGLEGRVLGLYGAIRNSKSEPYIGDGMQNIPYIAMNSFRSDDGEVVADPGATAWHTTYDNFQYTKDDWGAGLYWNKHYVMIGQCNETIAIADSLPNPDATTPVFEAEAKFFRAYTYFDMVRTFGEIPKIDFKINNPADGRIPKSSVADIYQLIIDDLTFAQQYLPTEWIGYPGRLTVYAAKSMLAKVLIYRQQWAQALALCEEVIGSGEYTLEPMYYKIYKKEGELGPESIFEIQASKLAQDGDTYWSRLGQSQGVRGSGTWDLGWGWNTPTAGLVASYEAGDKRKDATILYSNQFDGGEATGGYGQTVPNYTNALYWNKKVYNRYSDYIAAGQGTPGNEAQNTWINQRVLRLSDVILLAAEAANEIGGAANQIKARDWVNMIRDRAGLGPIAFVDQATMRAAIKKERRAEFAMEYDRFFDLVRWGDAISALAPFYQNKHRYFPIPQAAMDDNPQLVQNPEWP
jgi:hypothetical protein